jgi:TonB family protein
MMPSVNRTMSAPLRPSSRVLPASVEARFANRNVYTLAIPGPNLPEYGGDWIMWFSEGESNSEARASIAAPVPAKKFTSTDISAAYSGPLVAATVHFTAVIDRNGRISSAKVLRSKAPPDFQLEAIAELNSWEFKPATRNGEPIDVEVVVEIPFQLRPVQATAR